MTDPKLATSPTPLPSQQMGFFSTFRTRPIDLRYADQDADEEIVLFLRRDFITNVPWIALSLFALFLPALFLGLMPAFPFPLPDLSSPLVPILLGFYYLVIAAYALNNFLNWFYNISMVTTKKMIDVDYTLESKNVASALLDAIEEAEYTQTGFLADFFDYGDVMIQTEAEAPHFEFESVPKPAKVVDIITDLTPRRAGQ